MNPALRLGDRSIFPDLEARAYLNHAAIAPASTPVRETIVEVLGDYARQGVGAFPVWQAQRERLKEHLAALIGASAGEIALGTNTTRGVTDIALSIPWRKGDRVMVFRGEFPANVTPWQRAAELFQLELVFGSTRRLQQSLEHVADELKRGLRLVAVSLVQFQTGHRVPVEALAKLCHRHGAELFVDGIQGCGVVELNVHQAGVDYMSCGGHKWLLGMEGAAFLYVAAASAAKLRPSTAGWLSHEEPLDFLFRGAGHLRYDRKLRATADVFENGTSNVLGLAALGASVQVLLELGVGAIFKHVNAYHDALEPELVARGFRSLRATRPEERSGILAFSPPAQTEVTTLAARLRDCGIYVGIPDGNLRIAPHFANPLEEVGLVLSAVDEVVARESAGVAPARRHP
jgi:cysteine desulfurase / selenocysteine lyase